VSVYFGLYLKLNLDLSLQGTNRNAPFHFGSVSCFITYSLVYIYKLIGLVFIWLIFVYFKERGTSTEPPPRANFSATANQVSDDHVNEAYFFLTYWKIFNEPI